MHVCEPGMGSFTGITNIVGSDEMFFAKAFFLWGLKKKKDGCLKKTTNDETEK